MFETNVCIKIEYVIKAVALFGLYNPIHIYTLTLLIVCLPRINNTFEAMNLLFAFTETTI